jgi:mRNA interferase YafO
VTQIRIFHHEDLARRLTAVELTTLKADFKLYKETGVVPDNFGRDALYNHPNGLPIVKAEELSHIHLADADNPWPLRILQFNRTSDVHLVYCQGQTHEECYLLMAILSPNAHEQANSRDIMFKLGTMAERFHNQY